MLEPYRISPFVRSAWDLPRAVEQARPGNLLPSSLGWTGAIQNPRLLASIDAEAAMGYRARQIEFVRAAKWDRTTRPAADMSARDQILLAALTHLVRTNVPEGYVEFTGEGDITPHFADFEMYPLSVPNVEYVLEVDAAAFYQYVDHERLAYEIIGLTGLADAAESISTLLGEWMGRRVGLPQGPRASQALADIYISPVARALARAGFDFSRWSDDFRIAATSWSDVLRARLLVEEAFASVGLVVAPRKLRTYKTATYRLALERINDQWISGQASKQIAAELADEYFGGFEIPGEPDPEKVAAAGKVLREQLRSRDVTITSTRLVRHALGWLAGAQSPDALGRIHRLLFDYRHLTPVIAIYLKSMMGSKHERKAISTIVAEVSGAQLLPWQVGWLYSAMAHATSQSDEGAEASKVGLLDGTLPWFARGQAALALGALGALPSLSDFAGVFERAPDATRPDLVAAAVISQPEWIEQFTRGILDDPILADIANHPSEQVRSWL